MNKIKQLIPIFMLLTTSFCFASQPNEKPLNKEERSKVEVTEREIVTFAPPKGWKNADLDKLPSVIKMMLVGSGKDHFPPSLSLAVEPFKGTLKDYLKIVKDLNAKEKTEWKNLGKIETKAGSANLSQFDEKSNWGETRTMTAILVKNGNAYILSATALKSEFSEFYKDFFEAMRSLEIKPEQS